MTGDGLAGGRFVFVFGSGVRAITVDVAGADETCEGWIIGERIGESGPQRCVQQQFEDMLLALKRADRLRKEHHLSIDIRMSATIGAVRCARLGLSDVQKEIGRQGIRIVAREVRT